MKNYNWSVLLFLISILSCKNDEDSINVVTCTSNLENYLVEENFSTQTIDFDACSGNIVSNYPEEKELEKVVFNPSDENMIAYLKYDTNDPPFNCSLIVFDFCTGETLWINNDVDCSNLDWSKKDWILYSKGNFVYKVKPNGDELTQIGEPSGIWKRLMWNHEGTQIAGYEYNGSDNFFIADENLNFLKSLPFSSQYYFNDWSSNDEIIMTISGGNGNTYGIYKLNVSDESISEVYLPNGSQSFRNIIWGNDPNEIYWASSTGISKMDIASNQITQLIEKTSNNRVYLNLAISSDHSKMITIRNNLEQISDCEIDARQKLYFIDVNNDQEQPLTIE